MLCIFNAVPKMGFASSNTSSSVSVSNGCRHSNHPRRVLLYMNFASEKVEAYGSDWSIHTGLIGVSRLRAGLGSQHPSASSKLKIKLNALEHVEILIGGE